LQRREIISLSEDERRRVIGEEAQEAEQRLSPDAGVMLQACGSMQDGESGAIAADDTPPRRGWSLVADSGSRPDGSVPGYSGRSSAELVRWGRLSGDGRSGYMRRRRVLHVSKSLDTGRRFLESRKGFIFNRPLDPKRDKFADAGHLQLTLSARVTEQLLTNAPASFMDGSTMCY